MLQSGPPMYSVTGYMHLEDVDALQVSLLLSFLQLVRRLVDERHVVRGDRLDDPLRAEAGAAPNVHHLPVCGNFLKVVYTASVTSRQKEQIRTFRPGSSSFAGSNASSRISTVQCPGLTAQAQAHVCML